jgi:hypothetical protein
VGGQGVSVCVFGADKVFTSALQRRAVICSSRPCQTDAHAINEQRQSGRFADLNAI